MDDDPVEARHLEFFVAVAEELSFTRAAERVHAVQSTVSAGVQALEREIGASLFTRSTRQVTMTSAGRELLPQARAALEAMSQMRAIGSRSRGHVQGAVRVGIISHLESLELPRVLGGFHEAFPMVELSLHTSAKGSSGLLAEIRRGTTDVAFCGLPQTQLAGLFSQLLSRQRFVALLPARHPLAGRARVSLAKLLDDDFVELPMGFGTRHVVDDWLSEKGLHRRVTTEVPDLAMVPDFVAAGFGVAVTPATTDGAASRARHPGGEAVAVVPLTEPLVWDLCVIAREHGRSRAVDAVLEHLALNLPGA